VWQHIQGVVDNVISVLQ